MSRELSAEISGDIVKVSSLEIANAWNKYINDNVVDFTVINKIVVNSWTRCKILNVDPFVNNTAGIFGTQLEQRKRQREHLINIARPFMFNLYNFVKGSGFQVVLSDEQGVLLEVLGDPEILELTKGILLCPGGDWSEPIKGTNAIGTAIIEQKPVQIYGQEHFCQANHFLTCSAAPIFDPEGQIIGVLDVTGDYLKANPHTLGMVVAAVYAIESQLRLHKATSKLYMAYKHSNSIMESMSEGLLSLDSQGKVTHLNTIGSEILGISFAEAEGKNLEKLLKTKLPIMDVIRTGKGYSDREIMLVNEQGRRHFTSTTTPLIDETGKVIGATATLRKMQAVQQLVSKLSGTQAKFTFSHIIGYSKPLLDAVNLAKLAAGSVSTVLLSGESGTGKELFAQAIHSAGSRCKGAFVAINCGALPRDLIESELFGYEEGSFTGAQKGGRPGKFELANSGTIFLDEIGDMPLETQVKLLRVLQEKQVIRLGGHKIIPVDIRVIAASNRNLEESVEQGSFRGDLFYRLNVMNIHIPPLRARGNDLVILTKYLIKKLANKLNKRIVKIPSGFIEAMQNYSWPGNVRELENVLERAINVAEDGMLKVEFLPEKLRPKAPASVMEEGDNLTVEILPLWVTEKLAIEQALIEYKGKVTKVAQALGIGRNTLYRKIKDYQITCDIR